jgi:ribosomal protein S18 acetylase RimI-like enzyme
LGTELLQRTATSADASSLRVDRILKPGVQAPPFPAIALYRRAGFRFNYLEDEMRRSLETLPALATMPDELQLANWTPELHAVARAAYDLAFSTRPGAHIPAAEWTAWFPGQEDFRQDASFFALHEGRPVGFLFSSGIGEGWVDSIGVVPDWRGNGIARALLTRALHAYRASGEAEAGLRVNADNPNAYRVYERLGFAVARRHYTLVRST